MRATRAYIASMGTAAVMLGAALSLFAFVGTLVSFGAWPGLSAHENVDSLLVESVSAPVAEPLRISERPRPRGAATRERAAAGTPASASAPAAGPRTAAPVARVPGTPQTAAPAPTGGDAPVQEPAAQPAPQRTIERAAGEVQRTVETVTQQTNELVGEVGGQLQGPVDSLDRTLDGALR